MTIAILVILIVIGIMLIRRLDILLWIASDRSYNPWYWRIIESFKEALFGSGPIFRP